MNEELNRFRADCFLYACGKLDPAEATWMQQMLASHPELTLELEADQQLITAARYAYNAERLVAEPLVSFDAIANQLDGKKPALRSSLFTRILKLWNQPMQAGWAVTAMASVMMFAVVQTYQLHDATQDNLLSSQYRSVVIEPKPAMPIVEVVFSDEVTVSDLRRVLPGLNLVIICGPDEQGVTNLSVQSGSGEQALSNLKNSKLVLDAHLIQGKTSCGAH